MCLCLYWSEIAAYIRMCLYGYLMKRCGCVLPNFLAASPEHSPLYPLSLCTFPPSKVCLVHRLCSYECLCLHFLQHPIKSLAVLWLTQHRAKRRPYPPLPPPPPPPQPHSCVPSVSLDGQPIWFSWRKRIKTQCQAAVAHFHPGWPRLHRHVSGGGDDLDWSRPWQWVKKKKDQKRKVDCPTFS